jgi:hypothetical protein
MRLSRFTTGMAIVFFAAVDIATTTHGAEPFHAGGVGPCDGCHTMHNSADAPATGFGTARWLLQGTDSSSICLNCHTGLGAPESSSVFSPDGSALTPAGDFYWLTKDFAWSGGSRSGDSHGHNIISQDFGLMQDTQLAQAPGGTYQATFLGCTSCHDPHGKVKGGTANGMPPVSDSGSYGAAPGIGSITGNYRLLGDSQYDGGQLAEGFAFLHDAPVARQNAINKYGESDTSHVDYGSGMSEWCVNCHSDYQVNDHLQFEHPAGNTEKLNSDIISNYNTYIRTGDWSGSSSTAFLQFVPFERGIADPAQLDPTSTQGPDITSNVMCLSCHRAHASAFRAIGRWDFDATLLADSHPAFGDGGVSGNDVLYSYYGRDIVVEFGSGQRAFCEKCHDVAGP